MWIDQKSSVSDEMQDSDDGLQISFRSGGIRHLILLNKSMGFSQRFSIVLAGGDMHGKNQILPDLRYIERNPNIRFSQNIADTIWISGTYLGFSSGVKQEARKMRLCCDKKGKSIAWIHPPEL